MYPTGGECPNIFYAFSLSMKRITPGLLKHKKFRDNMIGNTLFYSVITYVTQAYTYHNSEL